MMRDMERETRTTIRSEDAGKILLDFLSRRFTYLGADGWEREIGKGTVLVNGARGESSTELKAGDVVRFVPESFEEPETDDRVGIIYEDERLLIVDKPPNLPVHPAGRYFKRTLWYFLVGRWPEARIVTRLDRETSGLVLIAKDAEEARRLNALQRAGLIGKSYLALVHGAFPAELAAKGILVPDAESPVRKKRAFVSESDPRYEALSPLGEACETCFALVRSGNGKSLVRARLLTGRTHQIRATLRSLGFPVVGDKLYGLDDRLFLRFIEGALSAEDEERLELHYQALRCERLSLAGEDGTAIEAAAPSLFDIS